MGNVSKLLTPFASALVLCLVLSQCTPARYTPPPRPPVPQQVSERPPLPPAAPPVSAEELLKRLNASLDRA